MAMAVLVAVVVVVVTVVIIMMIVKALTMTIMVIMMMVGLGGGGGGGGNVDDGEDASGTINKLVYAMTMAWSSPAPLTLNAPSNRQERGEGDVHNHQPQGLGRGLLPCAQPDPPGCWRRPVWSHLAGLFPRV